MVLQMNVQVNTTLTENFYTDPKSFCPLQMLC